MNKVFIFLLVIICFSAKAQDSVSALFLRNSYTHRNNLALMVDAFAKSTSKVLIREENSPAGYTLLDHLNSEVSTSLIKSQKWDFVVLQEQSQLPSFPNAEVENYVYPAAKSLSDLIKASNECAMPTFYRTWGRKNGDSKNCAVWPPVCTYVGMDSLLALRYKQMADSNKGIIIPVGEVWKKVREIFPTIELYKADESHPSIEGTYLAACCFYTCFYKVDPTLSKFNGTLTDSTANRIKRLTKWVVYNHFSKWNIGLNDPKSNQILLKNENGWLKLASNSNNATKIKWTVNDTVYYGDTIEVFFSVSGRYRVLLQTFGCHAIDTLSTWYYVSGQPVSVNKRIGANLSIYNADNLFQFKYMGQRSWLSFYDLNGRCIMERELLGDFQILKDELPSIFIVVLRNSQLIERHVLMK